MNKLKKTFCLVTVIFIVLSVGGYLFISQRYKSENGMRYVVMNRITQDIEEKLEVIAQREESIEEYTQSIEECTYAKNFFSFLTELIEARRWEENRSININEYIYAGIEIERPTAEDICEVKE